MQMLFLRRQLACTSSGREARRIDPSRESHWRYLKILQLADALVRCARDDDPLAPRRVKLFWRLKSDLATADSQPLQALTAAWRTRTFVGEERIAMSFC